jgi:hypothetical protein
MQISGRTVADHRNHDWACGALRRQFISSTRKAMKLADDVALVFDCTHKSGKTIALIMSTEGARTGRHEAVHQFLVSSLLSVALARSIPLPPPNAIGQLPLSRATGSPLPPRSAEPRGDGLNYALPWVALLLAGAIVLMPGLEFHPIGIAKPLLPTLVLLTIGFMLASTKGPRFGNVPGFVTNVSNNTFMQGSGVDGRSRPKDGGRHNFLQIRMVRRHWPSGGRPSPSSGTRIELEDAGGNEAHS